MLSKIRSWMFPVHREEIPFVRLLSLLQVCVTINFWMVHNLKDIAVMTAPGAGAECINYLKVFVFFMTIFFVAIYSKFARKVVQRKIVRSLLMMLICCWICFFLILLPYQESLQASSDTVLAWQQAYPSLRWLFPVLGYWIFSLFFMLAELWAMIGYSLLFWQFVNTTFTVDQSKRFYTSFVVMNGCTTILLGLFFSKFAKIMSAAGGNSFERYLVFMRYGCLLVAIICLCMMTLYNKLYAIQQGARCRQEEEFLQDKKDAEEGFLKSVKQVVASWYLGLVFILGLCYNFAHTMIDISWKQQVKRYCQDSLAVQQFFGDFTVRMGIGIMLCGFISTALVRKLGWAFSAMLTPIMMSITGSVFLFSVLFRNWGIDCVSAFATLKFAVFFGLWHEFMVRSMKHSLFNITRELVYVPLDYQMQVRGKAVADVLGGRVGKMLGALIPGFMLFFIQNSTQEDLVPYTTVIFWCIIVLWIMVVLALNKRFVALVNHKNM